MATTAAATEEVLEKRLAETRLVSPTWSRFWPRPSVRLQLMVVMTGLVVLVVAATTVANIAHLTSVIVSRTQEQTTQLAEQISYAVQQDLASTIAVDDPQGAYAALASSQSSVRALMESTVVTSRPIVYLYLTDKSGRIITDSHGGHELAANRHLIGDPENPRPDLTRFAAELPYIQLLRILFGPPVYEYSASLGENSLEGGLHIGISATVVRRELLSPIATNLVIGLLAIVGATIAAIGSSNLLMKPLKLISTSIEQMESGHAPRELGPAGLPRDQVITGVTNRLRQLGERLAGERSELEIMRGRLRQVIGHLEDRLLLINREGRVILASPDAEQILGLANSEMTGLPVDEVLGTDHPIVLLVQRAFNERRSFARSIAHVPFGDRTRQLVTSVQYIEDAGEPVGALISLRDYESFQRFESQWDLSKKLADLGRITSGIAHEVKNPLNAMVIHLEILRSKLESGGSNLAPQIEILDSEIKRLDRVVTTFLNFTRPVEVYLRPIDLNELIAQVVALASTEAEGRGVTISVALTDGPLLIKGDGDLLKQALLNIIINGCQSMPEGGPLKISTSRATDGSAQVVVRDRGVGIAAEARDRIFNLFHTTKRGGTGIGLAQAFRAVQLHNGSIRFDSQVGVGTAFEITLPASN
jgi:PAS domain S-box-containing protein